VNQGVTLTDPAERSEVYAQLNQIYYENAISFPLVNTTTHNFKQRWVQGRVTNPLFAGIQFDTLSKAEGAPNPTTFTLASISDVSNLDPALSYDTASGQLIQNVYETLVFFDGAETNIFVPRLADGGQGR
jgi:ABC-type transport system substrate-binding protein